MAKATMTTNLESLGHLMGLGLLVNFKVYVMGLWLYALGLGVSSFGVWGLGCRVLGLRILGFQVLTVYCKVEGVG